MAGRSDDRARRARCGRLDHRRGDRPPRGKTPAALPGMRLQIIVKHLWVNGICRQSSHKVSQDGLEGYSDHRCGCDYCRHLCPQTGPACGAVAGKDRQTLLFRSGGPVLKGVLAIKAGSTIKVRQDIKTVTGRILIPARHCCCSVPVG